MAGMRQTGRARRFGRRGIFAALLVAAAIAALPASASAAACPVNPGNATAWVGGSGSIHDEAKWTNGTPSASCDVSITAAGNYTVTMTGGVNTKSFTLGGPGSTPQLVISDESPNTNLDAQPAGITIAAGASVTLTCQVGGCPGGGPDISSGASPFSNAGTITVGPNTGGGAVVGGQITNTGTIEFEKSGSLSGKVTNQSLIGIDDGATATNSGSSCGDTGASVKNDTGGTIAADGTGSLSVINYEQGNGVVGGSSSAPINIPCGTLKYTGNGTSKVQATGGFDLSGAEMTSNQSLVVLAQSSNTNVTLKGNFTNKGTITLSCLPPGGPPPPVFGCSGGDTGGAGFNVNDKDFVNSGTFTVAAASGTGASVGANFEGSTTNTGTMTFDQTAALNGPVINQGAIDIADGKSVTSGGGCGSGASVKNDTGGSIDATGTGALFVLDYEQGNGTTTGANPVQMGGGCLKYTGNGASKVKVVGGFNLTGEMQPGQSLTVSAEGAPNVNAHLQGNFTNKGSITLTCTVACGPSGGVGFNVNDKDFVNSGTFTVAAASGTGASVGANFEGSTTNTGTMTFDQTAALNGPVINQGAIDIADGKSVTSGGGCGSGASVKNDTGGSIDATGTGALFVLDYEQGNGTTTGANPVQMGGGCLKYTGNGASKVKVVGGFNLTGEMQPGQSLTVSAEGAPNVNAHLQGNFTNKGSITFTCTPSPCNGPGFNGNGHLFTNAGTFTVDAAASSGTTLDMSSGGMTNSPTGTFQLNGHTNFNGGGPFANQGTLQIVASANTPSFPNTGAVVLDQSATSPTLNTGTLTNTGTIATSGASANTSTINGTVDQTGASAQVTVPAGTKLSLNNPLLLKAGALSGGGTLQGSVNNSGGTVAPGASPGTLAVGGNYTQGAGGSLEIEVEGTGAGEFDKLTVGGNATLGGTLALEPIDGYADSAAIGDSIRFLTYGGSRSGAFDTTTVTPSLSCPKQLTVSYDDAAKAADAVVSSSGSSCGSGGGGGGGGGGGTTTPPPAATQPVPETKLTAKPKAVVKTKKAKASVRFGFTSDVAGATFQCKLDKGAFAACKSPKSYKVKPGKHKFQVRAVGPGGTDARPASFSFKVVKQKN